MGCSIAKGLFCNECHQLMNAYEDNLRKIVEQ
jgi:hypothetical protein